MKTRTKVDVAGVLLAGHKEPAIDVGFDPATEWGRPPETLEPGRQGYRVEVLLNGVRFRSAIVSRGKRWFVLIDESLARRAGVAIGEPASVTVWPDQPAR